MPTPILRASALMLALAASGAVQAAYIVDTGTPPAGATNWALAPGTSLGASFDILAPTVVDAIEGYIDTFPGTVQVNLYGGPPTGTSLFSTVASVVGGGLPSWKVFGGLNWALPIGQYTVTFATPDGSLGMLGSAPNPLGMEWFTVGGSSWFPNSGLDIGVRVSAAVPGPAAVPEPATWASVLAGLALMGALRRRARAA